MLEKCIPSYGKSNGNDLNPSTFCIRLCISMLKLVMNCPQVDNALTNNCALGSVLDSTSFIPFAIAVMSLAHSVVIALTKSLEN